MAKEYPKNIDMEAYEGDDLGKVNDLEKMFQSAKDARQAKVNRWRRNEELYNGEILKPFGLPAYKSRIEPNIVHGVLETMYSIITDRPGIVDVMPKSENQMKAAYQAQQAVEWVLADKKAVRALSAMKRDGLTFGNGFLKIAIVDNELSFTCIDPYGFFIDPLATSIQDAQCVVFATPTYVDVVKDKYGKEVNPEGKIDEYRSFIKYDKAYATTTVTEIQSSHSVENESKSTDYKGGMCILKESWYYKDNELRLASWTGKTLLQDEKAPYDFIPVVMFKNYPSAHSIWGKGEPEIVESLATGASIALSQGLDSLILHGNPIVVMSKSLAKIPGNRLTDKPGQVIFTNGPHERVDRMAAGNISASTLPMAESMIKLADNVSGVHEVSRGVISGGVTASRAISQLQEAAQTIIRTKEREVGSDAIIDMYKMTLELLSKNYSKTINIRKPSEDGTGYMFEEIQPYELDADMDFKYVPGSSLPESRASRMDQALDLLGAGVLEGGEDFWRWTQVDGTKDKINQIAEAKAQREKDMQGEMDIIGSSTDENEILEALLRQRELSGAAEKTRQIQVEDKRAKNQ